ncbi:hypothetical protein BDW02DRAFT_569529 [Decorospora gaudefroyi]|uniref:F-box domain-containing protein n=1 Tax=Decorospora gaudefroyi TaxID=184978 RepID=A0A6A5KCC0_9PLEO|nr:hypothetical protein BDW02DRAFT_569529 [Decorospora gaudefroyi]
MASSGLLHSATISLPNELTLLIIDHLEDDNKALCALARASRGLQYLAEERLYRSISLLSVTDLDAIITAFTYRHDRVRAVQTLKILYQYRPEDLNDSDESRKTFNECVAHMANLREWHIESPYDNSHRWEAAGGEKWVEGDMHRFCCALEAACVEGPREADVIAAEHRLGKNVERTVGLALLESLTIHSHGIAVDFWELGGFHCLFRHPALRNLHVSCVAFPDAEIPELASHVNKTPLTSLIFDECELEPKSLLSILRTPARLKHLTLGENVFNYTRLRRSKPSLSKNPSATLEALSAVAHSLESLIHLDPTWRNDPSLNVLRSVRPHGEGLRNFHALVYLECDTDSLLHRAVIMNRDIAPPSLEILRVRRHWEAPSDLWEQPPDLDHYAALPSLTTLELLQSAYVGHDLSNASYICEADWLRNRHAKAYRLSKAGINLRMSLELHKSQSLIPPYLHGELLPIDICVYDANSIGFHRHIQPNDESKTGFCVSPKDSAAPNIPANMDDDEPPPETDQLGDTDIQLIRFETKTALRALTVRFLGSRYRPHMMEMFEDTSDEDEWDVDDLDEEEDMDLDVELSDDDDDDDFEDGHGPVFFELNGEFFIQDSDSESISGSDENEDEGEDEDGDDEMHDAVESQMSGI